MTAGQSRYRMRRHARRLRRYGLEPIAIVNPGDPLPEIAIVVIGRWLWRYRSELVPATVALAAFGSAWLLHRSYPHWWPMIAAAAIAIAALAVIKGRRPVDSQSGVVLGVAVSAREDSAASGRAVAGERPPVDGQVPVAVLGDGVVPVGEAQVVDRQ